MVKSIIKKNRMIISKTPYRISFFGGGSDYPEWYKNLMVQYCQLQ